MKRTMKLGETSLEQAAQQAAGNWQEFDCFVWYRRTELGDAENWTIVYTHHRDSGLLDQSNAAAIGSALESLIESGDVIPEDHNHWAVGWVAGFAIRVFRGSPRAGAITAAFRAYHDLMERMEDYPLLDEEDYSRREYDATLENIADAAWRIKRNYKLADGWESDVYSWLSDHRPDEIENRDDRGGYPDEDALQAAFDSLEFSGA